jgi:hypothetical protein
MLPSWKAGSGCSVRGLCWASLDETYTLAAAAIASSSIWYEEEIRVARLLHKRMDVRRHP